MKRMRHLEQWVVRQTLSVTVPSLCSCLPPLQGAGGAGGGGRCRSREEEQGKWGRREDGEGGSEVSKRPWGLARALGRGRREGGMGAEGRGG